MDTIGDRLRFLRRKKRLTMEQVSEYTDIPKSTLSGYENGHREPPPDKMQILVNFYNTSSDFILGIVDDDSPAEVTHNAKDYLQRKGLHWNGKPLTEKELRLIREFLET